MGGLDDEEWDWAPTADRRIGLRWRLAHLRRTLSEDRNAAWLGVHVEPTGVAGRKATNAASALADVLVAYTWWREQLAGLDDDDLNERIGEVAGPFADASRRSFVLHVVDELTHHCAEAALLRDLYAGR